MIYIIKLIFVAHIYLLLITIVSYIIEKITGLILIVTLFSEPKKNRDEAEGNTGLFTILYFTFLLLFLLYNIYIAKNAPDTYTFWKWLVIVIPLTIIFAIVFHKYQGREPREKDMK